ncbi:glycosyltransferase family 2 protein [Candidatus Microgenomates bacterium]|nr:MAG: glycosyltransferase family 2 protein [Candidatus Microgenomates bacterium]
MDLSIIIISYNTKDITIACLESLFGNYQEEFKKGKFEVIVVDNNSSDGSVEEIQNYSSTLRLRSRQELKIIKNERNFGFSKANNIGIKSSRGRYMLFLNSDTVVYPNTLTAMLDFMEANEKAGAATCSVIMPNNKIDDACHRGFPTPWNSFTHFSGLAKVFSRSMIFNGYNLAWANLDKPHEIDACCGAFMMVRRTGGEEVGWWDEDFFWYGEDLDFCFRLKEKKWKIFYVPQVSILHYKGVSGGIKKISKNLVVVDKETKKQAQRARFDAMRIFYKKHYEKNYPVPLNWLIYRGIFLGQKIASI